MTKQHIHIVFEHPPIPSRDRDWCAYYDEEEAATSGKAAWGATPVIARAELLEMDE
jgi:hypothetical protein